MLESFQETPKDRQFFSLISDGLGGVNKDLRLLGHSPRVPRSVIIREITPWYWGIGNIYVISTYLYNMYVFYRTPPMHNFKHKSR